MGWGRTKKGILVAAMVVGGVAALLGPRAVYSFVTEVYPSDPAKRQALEMCFLQDSRFNRLDASERANCYSRATLVGITIDSGVHEANPVDLHQAAAAGSMPRNDVRRVDEMRAALHLPH